MISSTHTHNDLAGRILAVLVFLVGIGLLCVVFALAYSLFRSPVPGLELPVKPGVPAPPAAGIGVALSAFARQIILLGLMTIAGSLIAGKGIHLYFSASQHHPHGGVAGGGAKNGTVAVSDSSAVPNVNTDLPSSD